MSTSEQIATPHADVVCTELKSGESVLLHLHTHTYFTLNQTGSLIWSLLEQKQPLGAIAQALETQFDVTLTQAKECVEQFVDDLVAEQLLILHNERQPA